MRLVMATGLAVGLAYLPYGMFDGSHGDKAAELGAQLRHALELSREVAEENARLELEVQALEKDSTALEDMARHELGMVYADELIIRIQGEP